jgi:phage nucleotide-binding protein
MGELFGGIEITPAEELPINMAILIWGNAGVGKTTLACTAPGKKLLVNFDPRGPASVSTVSDVSVADYSGMGPRVVEAFKQADPLNLGKVLHDYDTLVIDSLTTIADLTVAHGISLTKGASIERPSPGAYGARNALILALVTNVLRLTHNHGKHVIFIAHEGSPIRDEEGGLVSIPVYLGGQLPAQVGVRFSEIWALYELANNKKTIGVRPCRMRGPMKTRMFVTSGSPEFGWKYNADTQEGATIRDWHTRWIEGGKKKLALPG